MPSSNNLSTLAAFFKELALDLLFPTSCLGCGAPDTALCASCLASIPRLEPQCVGCGFRNEHGRTCSICKRNINALSRNIAAVSYEHPLARKAIAEFKYFGRRQIAASLADLAAETCIRRLAELTPRVREQIALLPIPLHPKRQRERGFSQSEILARRISARTGLPLINPKTIIRTTNTPSQTKMDGREERLANMKNVFAVRKSEPIAGKIILLIDDVATTGATLNAAAQSLKAAGAKSVWGLVVAHG